MAISVTNQTPRVSIVFYVKDGDRSPYQGRLEFDEKEYASLDQKQIETMQLDQFQSWQANTLKLQADTKAAEEVAANSGDDVVVGDDVSPQEARQRLSDVALASGITDEQFDALLRKAGQV